jgi:transcriptional regulator with XRE-family HTH domain
MAVLAKEVGVSQPAIAGIESGHRVGRPATMKKIAEALRVSRDDFQPG